MRICTVFQICCGTAAALLLPALVLAQFSSFSCEGRAAIKKNDGPGIMRQVQARYSRISGLTADFQQYSYLFALETSELSSGKMWFQRPGLMKWHYLEPDEQVFLVRQDTLWFYQKAEQQVVVDRFRSVLTSDVPVAFMLGLGDLERDFRFKRGCRSAEGVVLELVPAGVQAKQEGGEKKDAAEKGDGLQRLALLVGEDDFLPRGAEVTDVGGNITSILFVRRDYSAQIPADTFEPNFPKGLDWVDRRTSADSGLLPPALPVE